ncbi:transcription initiation factor IIF subunit beta [[Candida] jaroonii]|uniref:Transcription initiation factor IIF subunit beta n=1 Tax=[Candida] jaroonii TaxID=467808 RepID=A0ACA9YB55_9ASCO|nr:transcription initiation factor IIF subunit beta [[Candida] jaroonii]
MNSNSNIKKEDEPELLSDPEDFLEKGESLDMNLSGGNQKVWLVKLPKYLADKWMDKSLMGQQLGTVKIKRGGNSSGTGGGIGSNGNIIKLALKKELQDPGIPSEYDLSVTNSKVRNSYVFSEENLKHFKAENTEMSDDRPEEKEEDDPEVKRPRWSEFEGYNNESAPFVKTIPKKTALYGKIVHDCQIRPSRTDSKYKEFLGRKQTIQPLKARPKVVLLDEIPGVTHSNAGPSIKGKSTSVFLKSTTAKNKHEGRAIRMPKKDLLDLLFRLFEEYEYWSIKGLRERTRQPESYLKESLESIANLIKKGPYTSKYNLKPEYKKLRDAERNQNLDINNDNNDNEEDEEDMEDVI